MTVKEILAFARLRSDDNATPRKWEDEELLIYLNKAYARWCRRTKMLRESGTSMCEIPILSNLHTYTLNDLIVLIRAVNVESSGVPLLEKDTSWLDSFYYNWRDGSGGNPFFYIPDYSTGTIRFVPYYGEDGEFDDGVVSGTMAFDSVAKSVTLAGGGFTAAGYAADDEIDIAGSLNDGIFTIATVSDTVLTFDEAISNETVSTVLRKVEDYAELEVVSLEKFILSTQASTTPSIPEDYHVDLVNGMLSMAYLKPDTRTFNKDQAMELESSFLMAMDEAKQDLREKRNTRRVLSPHAGTI